MTISKLAITLNSPSDWEPWIELAKSHATSQRIWGYINPDNKEEVELLEPDIPTVATVHQLLLAERIPTSTGTVVPSTPIPEPDAPAPDPASTGPARSTRSQTAGRRSDGDDEDPIEPPPQQQRARPQIPAPTDAEIEARLKIENIRYKHDYQAYVHKEQALVNMPTIIQNSIKREYLQHTYNRHSAYEMLVSLKRKVSPNDFAALLDLRQQYKHLMKPPRQALDTWVNKWEEIYDRGIKLNMPELAAPSPHFDFLNAIQNILPHFYTINQDLVLKQARQNDIMEFTELLDTFRDAKRIQQAQQGKVLGG